MKTPSSLPEEDQREYERQRNSADIGARSLPLDMAAIVGLLVVGSVGAAMEGAISYSAFHFVFQPEVPGGPPSGSALLLTPATLLTAATMHAYLTKYQNALAWRLLERAVPWLALSFVLSMGLMAAKSILEHTGQSLFGANAGESDFLSDDYTPPRPPLFDQVVSTGFGLGLASLAMCNFYFVQVVFDSLKRRIRGAWDRFHADRGSKTQIDEIGACDMRLREIDAESELLQRELTQVASFAFAVRLAALLQEALGPIQNLVNAPPIIKRKDSVLHAPDRAEPEIDRAKLKEWLGHMNMNAHQIFAAINGAHPGKKK